MNSLLTDLRHGLRLLTRRPAFSLLAVAILALGLGAVAAVFGLCDEVLLRPLPYPEPERLVRIQGAGAEGEGSLSYPDFRDYRQRNRVFSGIALVDTGSVILTDGETPEALRGTRVTPGYFELLGVEPLLGRAFRPSDEEYGRHRVAILSYRLWQRRFGGDPEIVGRAVRLWGSYSYTVVGVLPAGFEDAGVHSLAPTEIWRPLAVAPDAMFRSGRSYDDAVARLAPGVTRRQAADDLGRIARDLEAEYPEDDFGQGVAVHDLYQATVGEVRPALGVLALAAALLLLIACVNVANLLLARGEARGRELAVRRSLGAGAGRLARLPLIEGLLLAGLGAVGGLLLAAWSAGLLAALASPYLPRFRGLSIDGRTIAFTLGAALLAGLLAGALPALRAASRRLAPTLRASAGGTLVGGRKGLQGVLAAAEVALALTLLIGAGLLGRSLSRMLAVDPGFDPRGVVTMELAADFEPVAELLARVRALPGVRQAGATSILPLTDNYSCDGFQIDARPVPAGQEPCAEYRVVTPGYFEAMGIPLLAGRLFDEEDRADAPPVALVNRAMADRFWPGEDPVGQHLTKGDGRGVSRLIVGVVGSVHHFGLDREEPPQYYDPLAQYPYSIYPAVAVRADVGAAALEPALRREVRALDPAAAATVRTLGEVVASSVARPRFRVELLGCFGLLAFLLAALGIYGVMAYWVGRRGREIGLRMALGAERQALVGQVLGEGLRLAAFGVLGGLAGGAVLGRLLARFLFRVSSLDPGTYAAAALLLAATAVVACTVPARRASRVDPMAALRSE